MKELSSDLRMHNGPLQKLSQSRLERNTKQLAYPRFIASLRLRHWSQWVAEFTPACASWRAATLTWMYLGRQNKTGWGNAVWKVFGHDNKSTYCPAWPVVTWRGESCVCCVDRCDLPQTINRSKSSLAGEAYIDSSDNRSLSCPRC